MEENLFNLLAEMDSFNSLDTASKNKVVNLKKFAIIKNLIHLLITRTGFVGEFANFAVNGMLVLTIGLIYKYNNDVGDEITNMKVFLYEFTDEDTSNLFVQYMTGVWERHFEDVKENNTSQEMYPKDRKLGKVDGINYVY